MDLEFGKVFRIPLNKHKNKDIAGHWVVLLFADKTSGKVCFQTLGSRMFKIFPNFGSFRNEHCCNCSTDKRLQDFLKLKKQPFYLDVDIVEFLNFRKYSFLNKETFLCMKRIVVDNYFDFESKVNSGVYSDCGSLLLQNKKGLLLAMRNSNEIPSNEQSLIIDFFKP